MCSFKICQESCLIKAIKGPENEEKNEEQTTRKPGVISSVNQIIIVPLLSPTFTVFNTNGAVSGRPAVELEASFLGTRGWYKK